MRSAAIIYARRLAPMAEFYRACFDLDVVADAAGYCVLESEAWTLSIVQVKAEVAARIELTDPPARREETPIKLGFDVARIAAARATIVQLGGRVDDHEWEFRGFRHCDMVDPEGNVAQLREALSTGP
jgi:predicted enzyme related to lactoylglutathione lyase